MGSGEEINKIKSLNRQRDLHIKADIVNLSACLCEWWYDLILLLKDTNRGHSVRRRRVVYFEKCWHFRSFGRRKTALKIPSAQWRHNVDLLLCECRNHIHRHNAKPWAFESLSVKLFNMPLQPGNASSEAFQREITCNSPVVSTQWLSTSSFSHYCLISWEQFSEAEEPSKKGSQSLWVALRM